MQRKSIKANVMYNMVYQVLNIILPFITTPYVSRVLGAENIGIYSYTYSIVSTFVMIGSLGIGTYGQREIAAADNKKQMSVVFWEIQTVKLLAVCISLLVYLAFVFLYKEYLIYFLIQLPYFVAAILDISWLFQGIENFQYVALRNIIIKLVSLVLILVFVSTQESLIWYLLILCGSQLIGNAIMWIKVPEVVEKPKIDVGRLRNHIQPVLVYFIPTISYQVYAVLDKTMLGILGTDITDNGYYEQANKLINMVTIVVTSYTVVLRSRMTVYFRDRSEELIKRQLDQSAHFVGLIVFPMSFGLAAMAPNIVPWFFGSGYEKVSTLLVLFSPFFVIHSTGLYLGTHILTPGGLQGKSNIGQCAAAVVNICLNACLIPLWGSIGAVIASVLAECVILVFYFIFSRQYVRVSNIIKIYSKYFVSAFIMFVALAFLEPHLPVSIVGTVVGVMSGAAIYFLILVVLKDNYFIRSAQMLIRGFINKMAKQR